MAERAARTYVLARSPSALPAWRQACELAGVTTSTSTWPAEVHAVCARSLVGLIVVDDSGGERLVEQLCAQGPPGPPIIAVTSSEVSARLVSLRAGAVECVGSEAPPVELAARARRRMPGTQVPGALPVALVAGARQARPWMLALAEEGWTGMVASELSLALAVAALRAPGGVVLDAREPHFPVGRSVARLREACLADVPLVVLGDDRDEEQALAAGADAFVPASQGAVGAAQRLGELEHGALPPLMPVGLAGTRVLWFGPAGGPLYAALHQESDVAHADLLADAHELLAAVPVDLIVVAGPATSLRHPTDRDVPVAVVGDQSASHDANPLPADVELALARARALLRRRRHLVEARRAHVELGRRRLDSAEEQAVRSLAESRAHLVAELERSRARIEETAQRLREAHLAAERLASAKSRFLSSVSHELRTPLNAILGFGKVLEGGAYGPLNDRQRAYLTDIVQAGDHMLRMVDDLLDLQRLDEGRDRYDPRPAPIGPVIERAVRLVRPLAGELGHQLDAHIGVLPECTVDARALLQILVNLLSNAVKFTPPRGHIEVSALTVGPEVAVSVRDNGIGIAADDHERIFEYFEQAVPPPGGPGRGSGIGLALVRALVRRLGGQIRVDSQPGKGSTFTFTLPVSEAQAAEPDREVS